MYIISKVEGDFNPKTTYKAKSLDDAKRCIRKILGEFLKCQIICSIKVVNFAIKELTSKGYVKIWELCRKTAHSSYPYENDKIILINTDKLDKYS